MHPSFFIPVLLKYSSLTLHWYESLVNVSRVRGFTAYYHDGTELKRDALVSHSLVHVAGMERGLQNPALSGDNSVWILISLIVVLLGSGDLMVHIQL